MDDYPEGITLLAADCGKVGFFLPGQVHAADPVESRNDAMFVPVQGNGRIHLRLECVPARACENRIGEDSLLGIPVKEDSGRAEEGTFVQDFLESLGQERFRRGNRPNRIRDRVYRFKRPVISCDAFKFHLSTVARVSVHVCGTSRDKTPAQTKGKSFPLCPRNARRIYGKRRRHKQEDQGERSEHLDIAQGFAVIGKLLANIRMG